MKKSEKISKYRVGLKQKKTERLRQKSEEKKRQRNIRNNSRRKSFVEQKTKRGNLFQPLPPKKVKISAMSDFSLLESPENVLSYIKNIDEAINRNKYKKTIIFDLSQVTKMDIGSIGLLLSKINELSRFGLRSEGNFPQNEQCRQLIYESGFLEHVRDLRGRKFKLDQGNKNLMVNRGFDKTSNELVGSAIRGAVNHLIGQEEPFRPLYSIAQEMCANSVEHANPQNKNWLLSVWYKDVNTVCFTMTDIGSGILGTLKRKKSQIFKEEVLLTDDREILERAFDKKYTSQTKDINRNKGLPKIKSISSENFINNLTVITNNVLLDFTDNTKSRVLGKKLGGTFYYWELNENCINIWKNRNLQ